MEISPSEYESESERFYDASESEGEEDLVPDDADMSLIQDEEETRAAREIARACPPKWANKAGNMKTA